MGIFHGFAYRLPTDFRGCHGWTEKPHPIDRWPGGRLHLTAHSLKSIRIASIAHHAAGNPTSDLARRTLKLIDPETVTSAAGIVKSFEAAAYTIGGNKDLSEHGKREHVRAAADSRLAGLADVAKSFTKMQVEHQAKQAAALRDVAPATDTAGTLVDLALAAQVKAENPAPFKLEMSSERVRKAVARLPVELTGINEATHARIVGSLVDSYTAAELHEESAALASARMVIQHSINDLQASARWEAPELVKWFGNDWELPGVVSTLMNRLHAQNGASEAAAE